MNKEIDSFSFKEKNDIKKYNDFDMEIFNKISEFERKSDEMMNSLMKKIETLLKKQSDDIDFLKKMLMSTNSFDGNINSDFISELKYEYNFLKYNFTKREKEVAILILDNLSQKEIAYNLNISIKTVSSLTNNLYKKTGTNNRISFIKLICISSLKGNP